MFKWVENAVIKVAINAVAKEIENAETKDPKILEFRDALFNKTVNQFMSWSTSQLGGIDMNIISPIQLFKKRLEPLRDDVEGYIVKFIDGLKPKK